MSERHGRGLSLAVNNRTTNVIVVGTDVMSCYPQYMDVFRMPEFSLPGVFMSEMGLRRHEDRLKMLDKEEGIGAVAIHGSLVPATNGELDEPGVSRSLHAPALIREMLGVLPLTVYLPMRHPLEYGTLQEYGFDGVVEPSTPMREIAAAARLIRALQVVYNGRDQEIPHAEDYTLLQIPANSGPSAVSAMAEVPLRAVSSEGTDSHQPARVQRHPWWQHRRA